MADPIIGTWKLNVAQSKFSPVFLAMLKRAAPKESTEVYKEIEGDQIEFTGTAIRTDGSSSSWKLVWPRQGGTVKVLEGGIPGLSYVQTLIEPGHWYVTALMNGIQMGVRSKSFSQDGKVMNQMVKGFDLEGNLIEQIEVFDKQ
jgi:hypothetical protein